FFLLKLIAFIIDGDVWLVDCGEGTQIQIQKSTLKPGRVTKIFVTHLHGDHVFGLPGLLCTLGNQATKKPKDFLFEIYGPLGLKKFLRVILSLSQSPLPFPFVVHELVPIEAQLDNVQWPPIPMDSQSSDPPHPQEGISRLIHPSEDGIWEVMDSGGYNVRASWLRHRVACFGYCIQEPDSPGTLNSQKLKELGIPPGPLYGQLKQGHSVVSPHGTMIHPEDIMGTKKQGRKLVILGDTCESSAMLKLAEGCNVLVHEATLENAMEEKAKENGHSSPRMAASFASSVHAKLLVLTHFSQRYHDSLQQSLMDEVGSFSFL
ncbi:unnamed protein product, partial [Darwinula stevensoni]